MNLRDLQQDRNNCTPIKEWQLTSDAVYKHVAKHQKKNGDVVTVELFLNQASADAHSLCQLSVVNITDNPMLQETLTADKERYKVFIEQSSEGIFRQELIQPMPVDFLFEEMLEHIKINCVLAECNQAMAQMYGYSQPGELIGTLSKDLLDFTDPANINYLKNFVTNGFKVTDAESHEKDKNGKSCYFLNNAVGIVKDGKLLRIWGTQRDITEKKVIQEKIKLLANLVEQTSDVLTAADLDFIPVTWNKASEKIYGITADQAIGTNIRKYIDITYENATRDDVRKTLKEKGEWRGETYFRHPITHQEVTLLSTFKSLYDEKGEALGYVIASTDITERKASESKLKESEQRFRTMADAAPVMIWMANAENVLTYMNRPMQGFTGISLEAQNNLVWSSLLHPDDKEENLNKFETSSQNKLPVTLIYRIKNSEGYFRWVQSTATPRFLEDKTFVGYIGSIIEIHDTKLKEEKLQYQATVLDNVLDVVVTTDLNFCVKTWNRHAEELYGYKEHEVVGTRMSTFVHFDYITQSKEEALAVLQIKGTWRGEVAYTNKKGERKHYIHTVTYVHSPGGEKIGVLAVGRDITEKKNAEKKLQESETFYRTLISDSLDGILLVNPDGIITFVSPSVKNILHFNPDEVLGKSAFEFVHADDLTFALESLEKEVSQNPEYKSIVIRLRKKDGTWVWCMVRGHNLLRNPYVKSVAIYFHDDTLRKKASEALKESEQRFRSLISEIQIGVILYDNQARIIMCNKMVLDMYQTNEDQVISKNIYDLIPDVIDEEGKHFPKEERPIYKALKQKKTVKDVVVGIKLAARPGISWLLVNADPILDENGNIRHIISSFKDITERKKLEEKILFDQIAQQKLLTQATIDGQEKERREIGKELHDNIGQQLTTAKLFLDMALSTSNPESQEMISMAIRSVSDLINEVRGISRSLTPPTLGDLGLIDSVYDLIETIEKTQTFNIDLDVSYFSERNVSENKKLMLFRIIQEQLNNIIKHAGADKVHIVLNNEEGSIKLRITDNGRGFDTLQRKIGLGLTNIRNRTELFGGIMSLQTAVGKGCKLIVDIPLV